MVISDDAMHLGVGHVEGVGEDRNQGAVDVAGAVLHGVQRGHQAAGHGGKAPNQRPKRLEIRHVLMGGHDCEL